MPKIITFTHATLDGYIDEPHKWSFQYSNAELQDYALKMTLPTPDHVNAITQYVVASQPVDTTAWNPTVIIAGPDLLDEVSRLKRAEGGDILIWGTGRLTDAYRPTSAR